jgi:hypothetical protein
VNRRQNRVLVGDESGDLLRLQYLGHDGAAVGCGDDASVVAAEGRIVVAGRGRRRHGEREAQT